MEALGDLPALQAMTLALNHISHIPDHAFSRLSRLVVLYVTLPPPPNVSATAPTRELRQPVLARPRRETVRLVSRVLV